MKVCFSEAYNVRILYKCHVCLEEIKNGVFPGTSDMRTTTMALTQERQNITTVLV